MTGNPDPANLVEELAQAARDLERGANRLVRLTREFEGEGEGDQWRPGPQLRWLDLVNDELIRLASDYEEQEKRAPAVAVLQARAEKAARLKDPELYADYHRLDTEVRALTKWVSAKGKAVSARQSASKGERELAGLR